MSTPLQSTFTSGNIVFNDVDGFTVGTVDGVIGVDTDAGTVTLTAGWLARALPMT